MTVAELILVLSGLDSSLRVIVRGYEGGYNDAAPDKIMTVALEVNKGTWYYGLHDQVTDYEPYPDYEHVQAICL
jgi:hypothetical protein